MCAVCTTTRHARINNSESRADMLEAEILKDYFTEMLNQFDNSGQFVQLMCEVHFCGPKNVL